MEELKCICGGEVVNNKCTTCGRVYEKCTICGEYSDEVYDGICSDCFYNITYEREGGDKCS